MTSRSLGRPTVQLLAARAFVWPLGLVNSVILARSLGVDRLGGYAYAVGLAALFALVPNFGTAAVLTREVARDAAGAGAWIRAGVRAQFLLSGAMVAAVPAFAALLPLQPVPVAYVVLAALQLALGTLAWPYLAVLGGHLRYDRVAVVEIVSSLAGTASLVVAAARSSGVAGFLSAHVLAAALSVVVVRHAARPFLPPAGTPALSLRALFRAATPFGGVAVAQSLYTRIDVLLLGQLASAAAVGLYGAAYKPITMMVYFGSTVAGAIFPVMARADGRSSASLDRVLRGALVAGPAMALALTGFATPGLALLYGADFAPAGPILGVLAWSAAANWLYAPLASTMQARGRERAWFAALLVGLALNGGANLVLIPRWGGVGAAAAALISEAVLLALAGWLTAGSGALARVRRSAVRAAGATAVAGAVLVYAAPAGIVLATVAALLVYVGLLPLLGLVTSREALMVADWLRQAATASFRG